MNTAEVLGAAFVQDPLMSYAFPRARTREKQLTRLFSAVDGYSRRYGGIETAPNQAGAVLWRSGKYFPLPLSQVIQSGLIWTPLKIGPSAFVRLEKHEFVCEREIASRAPKGFAYLWVLGVHPKAQGKGLAKQLVYQTLNAMKSHGHSACVLSTENPNNMAFYKHLGFEQIHTGVVSASQLPYWIFSQKLSDR